jgi:competence protein ComEC
VISSSNKNILSKIFTYIYSTLFSSIIASIATAPFAAYHFNQFSGYGVITNLIAVPVTSFFIMPPLIIAFLFYPFNIHILPLKIMSFGINILIELSSYIASLPMSVSKIPYISPLCIMVFTLSGLWFTLWKYKIRYFSILIILLSIIIYMTTKKADIIASNKIYGYVNNKEQFIFANNKLRGFSRESWLNYYAQKDYYYYHNNDDQYNCDNVSCKYHRNNYDIIFLKDKLENRNCIVYDLVVDYSNNDFLENCNNGKYLKIEKNIYLIYLDDDIKIDDLESYVGNRKWNIKIN